MSTTTTKLAPLPCPAGCEEGRTWEELPGFARATVAHRCTTCRGTGFAICSAAGCASAATLTGEDGTGLYCGTACAHRDHNWPACTECQEEPQEIDSPWCGTTCEASFRTRADAAAGRTVIPAEIAGWLTDAAASEVA